MRHEKIAKAGTYEAVDLDRLQFQAAQPETPFRSAAAVPDVPAAVGKLLVASYVTLLGTFAVTTAHSPQAMFAIAICTVFLVMYLGVPRVVLGAERGQGSRPSFGIFLRRGLETYTGHCSGKEVLVQMLVVPVVLTLCGLAVGVIALNVL